MSRDMVVLVRETKYDAKNDKFISKFDNFNVLVGPKQSVDSLQPIIEEFLKGLGGSYKVNWRV
jgi:hypothetical protein